jgi:competence protein ComEC
VELRNAFNITGLTHILSISGSHFGLFSVLLFGIFRFIIRAFPYRTLQRITIYLTPSQVAAMLCLPVMLAYLGLSGASIPAIRSFIMIGLFLLGLVIGRKGYWLNSLLFAAFILVLWEPQAIFNPSFQLSFLAVLFIGFAIPDREDGKAGGGKVFRYAKIATLMTLSASIGTAPLVAYYFHYFSVISPISNLFIAPLIGFAVIPLSVALCFLFLITGRFIFTPIVSFFSDISILSVKLLSDILFAAVNIPAFPVIMILFFYGASYFISCSTGGDIY